MTLLLILATIILIAFKPTYLVFTIPMDENLVLPEGWTSGMKHCTRMALGHALCAYWLNQFCLTENERLDMKFVPFWKVKYIEGNENTT